MAVREVIRLGDPLLRRRSDPIQDPGAAEIGRLVEDLRDTLAHWRESTGYGRGIAAPQIGVLRRVVFLNVDGPLPLLNPVIVDASTERMVVWDGCLSFLEIFCQVVRHRWIEIEYQTPSGARQTLRAEGDLSELLQHEIDHLDGILTVDRMVDSTTLCTRAEFEKRYRAESPYG